MAFIGFKVSAMAPFSPLWLIITFMHDLRWQCRTRKTRLKFNHFLIYVFMQPVDDHERNIAMRLRLVWHASRALEHSCCAAKIWDQTENLLLCTTNAESDRNIFGFLSFWRVQISAAQCWSKLQIFFLSVFYRGLRARCLFQKAQSEASSWSTC